MRANPTDAEKRLWSILRGKRLAGYKFRRQQVIEPYIVDYVCFETRTIIEADGSQHAASDYDIERDAWLTAQGFVVARFWNNDILARTEQVAEAIWQALNQAPPLPAAARLSLSRKGRGFDSGVS